MHIFNLPIKNSTPLLSHDQTLMDTPPQVLFFERLAVYMCISFLEVAAGHGGDLCSEVVRLLLNALAHHNALEPQYLGAVLLQQLAHRQIGVLHEGLAVQADLLQVLIQPTVDHFGDNVGGLPRVRYLGGQDLALLFNVRGRHAVGRGVGGVQGRHVHGDVLGHLLAAALQLHEHADGAHVHVAAGHGARAAHGGHAAHLDVLANLGHQCRAGGLQGLALHLGAHQGLHVLAAHAQGGVGHAATVLQEAGVLGHEVGLAVHLHQHSAVAGDGSGDFAFCGDARGLLVGLGET
mmetsp:Transcript_13563/g.24430  ORF Transcript_13563/g.24430 Transcript_13563/m.24430 type:complete len:292 (+) Transcript_13563:54-929(+)